MTDRIEAMTNHSEGGTPRTDEQCCAATVEEMCEGTLKHYDDISTKACHWNNQVPQAIKFWYLEKPKLERDLSASQSALADKEREKQRLIEAFAHWHVNAGDGTDRCKACGLDLRNEIHASSSYEAAKARQRTTRPAPPASPAG